MYDFKAFLAIPGISDNRLNKTSSFGEFTTQAKTYTRDLREYALTKYPDAHLYLLKCVDEMLVRVEPSKAFIDNVLNIGQWIYQQYTAKTIPMEKNKPAFVNALTAQFGFMSGVVVGELLEGDNPDKNMPDYIQFKMLDGTRQYQLTLWFAESAFRLQYPEYEILLIPPLPDVNDLINGKVNVNNRILELPASRVVNAIQETRGEYPETSLVSYDIVWHDPSDFNAVLKTTWTAVVYGNGNDTELVKDAIRDYIDRNSEYDKWAEIYPDLYSENEFIIIPDWANVAVPPNAMDVGLYGSITNVSQLQDTLTKFLPSGYTTAKNKHVIDNMLVGSAYYRTLMFAIIGNPNNRDKVYDLRTVFTDYMALDTQDVDFVRMSGQTQEWTLALNTALDKAYEYKPTDVLPPEYTRIIRRGIHFLSFNYNGFSYTILTKHAFDKGVI